MRSASQVTGNGRYLLIACARGTVLSRVETVTCRYLAAAAVERLAAALERAKQARRAGRRWPPQRPEMYDVTPKEEKP